MREWSQRDDAGADAPGQPPSSVRVSGCGDWLRVCSSVQQIEQLFHTRLHTYSHVGAEELALRSLRAAASTGTAAAAAAAPPSEAAVSAAPDAPPSALRMSHVEWSDVDGVGVRASRELRVPKHVIPWVAFVGGINTPPAAQAEA